MLKVLIIDSDSDFASLVGRDLLKAGHETRIVGDAKYGIVRAKAFEADLVLLSASVPGVTTPDLIQELKPLVPGRIVVCGDSDNAEEIQIAVQAGAADYVLKSSGVDAILKRVLPSDSSGEESPDSDSGSDSESEEAEDAPTVESSAQDTTLKNPAMTSLRAPVKDGKRPFVVIVANENEEKRSFIREIVERLNTSLHVIEVATSEQAVAAAAGNRTVMVILDWEIKNIPAKQTMQKIREAKNGKAVAQFVTYKSHSPEKQRVAMFAGAMAFAGEPWDDGSLEGQIKHALDVIRKRRRKAKLMALKAQEEKAAKKVS